MRQRQPKTKEFRVRKHFRNQVAFDVINLYATSNVPFSRFRRIGIVANRYFNISGYIRSCNEYVDGKRNFCPLVYDNGYEHLYDDPYLDAKTYVITGKMASEEYEKTIEWFVSHCLEIDPNGRESMTTIFMIYVNEMMMAHYDVFYSRTSGFDSALEKVLGRSVYSESNTGRDSMTSRVLCGVRFKDEIIEKYQLNILVPRFHFFSDMIYRSDLLEHFEVGPQYNIGQSDLHDFVIHFLMKKNIDRANEYADVYEIPDPVTVTRFFNETSYTHYDNGLKVMHGIRIRGTENKIPFERVCASNGIPRFSYKYFLHLREYLKEHPDLKQIYNQAHDPEYRIK